MPTKDELENQIYEKMSQENAAFLAEMKTSLDKGTQRKTTENELPSLTQCTA